MPILPQNPGGIATAEFVLSANGATDPTTGKVSLALQVPGNSVATPGYQGLNPLANGRYINQASFFFGSPQIGDKISAIAVVDTAGVMPAQDQALFPAYPNIVSLIEPLVPSGNQQLFINQMFQINQNGQVFIPAGLFVVVSAVAANNRADTFYANVAWSMFIP